MTLVIFCRFNETSVARWRVAVDLCRLNARPLPTRFLEECARDNDWLAFLLLAQIYQYSGTEVRAQARMRASGWSKRGSSQR